MTASHSWFFENFRTSPLVFCGKGLLRSVDTKKCPTRNAWGVDEKRGKREVNSLSTDCVSIHQISHPKHQNYLNGRWQTKHRFGFWLPTFFCPFRFLKQQPIIKNSSLTRMLWFLFDSSRTKYFYFTLGEQNVMKARDLSFIP